MRSGEDCKLLTFPQACLVRVFWVGKYRGLNQMVVTEKSFDELMKENMNILEDGQKIILDVLLKEIITHKYETFSQLKGAIENHLDRLKGGNHGVS